MGIIEGKGLKITGIGKLKTTMEVKEDKEGNSSVAHSLSLAIDLSDAEATWIEKQAKLQTKWTLELYAGSFNLPLKEQ